MSSLPFYPFHLFQPFRHFLPFYPAQGLSMSVRHLARDRTDRKEGMNRKEEEVKKEMSPVTHYGNSERREPHL